MEVLYKYIMPLIFVGLWSSGYIFVEIGLQDSTPLIFLTLRLAIASSFMGILLLLKRKKISLNKHQYVLIALTGIFLQAVYLGFFTIALYEKLSPGILAIILGTQPLLMAIAMQERLRLIQKLGLLLGFLGLLLTVSNSIFVGRVSTFGLISSLLALSGITAGTLLQKRYCTEVSLDIKMFIHYLMSFFVVFGASIFFEKTHIEWSTDFIIALIWVSIVMSICAFFLFFYLLKQGKSTHATSLLYCVPPVAAIVDFIVFQHSIPMWSIIGMILVMLSLIFIRVTPGQVEEKCV